MTDETHECRLCHFQYHGVALAVCPGCFTRFEPADPRPSEPVGEIPTKEELKEAARLVRTLEEQCGVDSGAMHRYSGAAVNAHLDAIARALSALRMRLVSEHNAALAACATTASQWGEEVQRLTRAIADERGKHVAEIAGLQDGAALRDAQAIIARLERERDEALERRRAWQKNAEDSARGGVLAIERAERAEAALAAEREQKERYELRLLAAAELFKAIRVAIGETEPMEAGDLPGRVAATMAALEAERDRLRSALDEAIDRFKTLCMRGDLDEEDAATTQRLIARWRTEE